MPHAALISGIPTRFVLAIGTYWMQCGPYPRQNDSPLRTATLLLNKRWPPDLLTTMATNSQV